MYDILIQNGFIPDGTGIPVQSENQGKIHTTMRMIDWANEEGR